MSFRFLYVLAGLTAAAGSSAIGYKLLSFNSKENPIEDSNVQEKLIKNQEKDYLSDPNTIQRTETEDSLKIPEIPKKEETFNGYLLFTTNSNEVKVNEILIGTKLKTTLPHYYAVLLDNDEYKNWENNQKNNEEDTEDEDNEPKLEDTNFTILVKTKVSRKKSQEYLNGLTKKLSISGKLPQTGIYDKESLKDYLIENKTKENEFFKNYFEENTYEEILKKLEELIKK